MADIGYWIVAGLGLVGLVRLVLSRRGEAWVLVVSIVGTTIVPLGLFGDSRFKVPVMAAADHRRRLCRGSPLARRVAVAPTIPSRRRRRRPTATAAV